MAPGLSRALVDDRDARFTKACIKVINANTAPPYPDVIVSKLGTNIH